MMIRKAALEKEHVEWLDFLYFFLWAIYGLR